MKLVVNKKITEIDENKQEKTHTIKVINSDLIEQLNLTQLEVILLHLLNIGAITNKISNEGYGYRHIPKIIETLKKRYGAEIETKMPYGEYEILKDKCHYLGIEIIQDCKGNKGCIYKQLKRLEQENEQLKRSIDRIMQEKEIKTIDLDIAVENERLKEEIKYLEEEKKEKIQLLEQIINILYPNANDDELFTVTFNSEYIDKLKTYIQALREIREIAEKEIVCDDCNFEGTDKCDARMCTHFYLNDFSKDILDKINEVIGEKE